MSTSGHLHTALLRPAVAQILRATGFNYTRTTVLDTVTDLAARYLLRLASSTAQIAFETHTDYVPTIHDVRLALLDAGALRPQLSETEEEARGVEEINGEQVPFEDMRGVDSFISWAQGPVNKEIRRVAGFDVDGDVGEMPAGLDEQQEDYVTALKKKHSKTGEESRYQGSVLGKDADAQPVAIVGSTTSSITGWAKALRSAHAAQTSVAGATAVLDSPATSGFSSAPPTPLDDVDEHMSDAR